MSRFINFLLTIILFLFIISFSIAFVILFRPFYYFHINYLNLPETTGYTYNEIKEAYDDIMDYTTLNKPFSVGNLKYSTEGYNHFKDCKNLFILDFIIVGITGIVLITKNKLFKKKEIHDYNYKLWGGVLSISFLVSLFLIILLFGFNDFFELFHRFFFFGKTNWLFNPQTDEIIKCLPKQFFMNCGILIVLLVFIISIVFIIVGRKKQKKNKIN